MTDLRSGLGLGEAETVEATPQYSGPPAVSPLDQAIEVAGGARKPAVNADSETLNTAAFTARGNEPFWLVDVSGGTAVYKTPENQSGRSIAVRRLVFAQGVEYAGELNGQVFALTIRGQDCVDSMSGARFPMSAQLKIGGRMSSGCAAPAGQMPAPEAAAAADAPSAATAG
ncbi:hypothetical protein MLD63_09510 [Paracoccus sp. TK19116]|uniref:Uncharacterized protein n=2 Tax=Paracoccus albicereus TaxID=2922394 RepID=A0ABT1MQT1_9RHOB|nr:hypothetical protein [Paracoccus albicereus]